MLKILHATFKHLYQCIHPLPVIIVLLVICSHSQSHVRTKIITLEKYSPECDTLLFLAAKALANAPANPPWASPPAAAPPPALGAGAAGSLPGTAAALRSRLSLSDTFLSFAPPRISPNRPSRPGTAIFGTAAAVSLPTPTSPPGARGGIGGGGGGPPDDGMGGGGGGGGAPAEGGIGGGGGGRPGDAVGGRGGGGGALPPGGGGTGLAALGGKGGGPGGPAFPRGGGGGGIPTAAAFATW